MLAEFWGEAVMTAVHLLNRSPTKSLEGKTLYEAWHGRTPVVRHLCTFGWLAYVKELKLNAVSKLSDKSTSGVFIGYAEGVKAYRILDPVIWRVRTTRDVIFDEGHGWDWSKETNDSATTLSSEFTVDYAELEGFGGAGNSPSASGSPAPAPRTPSPAPDSTPPASPTTSLEHSGSRTLVFASPLEGDEDRIDTAHDDTPLRYRTVNDILGDQAMMPGSVQRNIDAELHLTHTGGPCSLVEAEGDAAWCATMQQEMDSIEHNRTWELVDLPAGHRPITLKWVFKLKKNEAGEVVKHMSRLVARGFIQQEGIDYDNAFAPVARIKSIRILFMLATQEGCDIPPLSRDNQS
jgi:hypothetical protein